MRPTGGRSRLVLGVGVLGAGAVFAAAADLSAPEVRPGAVVADVFVGVAFGLAAVLGAGPEAERWLVGGVGAAWLAGSWSAVARPWHVGVLVLALGLFPAGTVRKRRDLVVVALAVPAAAGLFDQAGLAVVLFGTAALTAPRRWPVAAGMLWAPAAAGAVAILFAGAWVVTAQRRADADPQIVLAAYQSALVLVAATFPGAARSVVRAGSRLTQRSVGFLEAAGLAGVTAELRVALADPDLRVVPWSRDAKAFVDDEGAGLGRPPDGALHVTDTEGPVALVLSQALAAAADPETADAVAAVVRLALTHERLQNERQAQLEQLRAARLRLIAARDHARDRLAGDLRNAVLEPLRAARGVVADAVGADGSSAGPAEGPLRVAMGEIDRARDDIAGLTAGVPPTELGSGRLPGALRSMVGSIPAHVVLDVDDGAAAGELEEATLYHVCSEALTNVVKHADAATVTITLHRAGSGLELCVADDGRGGADPGGFGLAGLADRVGAAGGRLHVESVPGAGTVLTASLPVRRSSSRE